VGYEIVFNALAQEYLGSLSEGVTEVIENALDALELNPTLYETVQFRTAYLLTVGGHDIAWTYSNRENELIVASIRPIR
jgi:hypothetical protein